MSDTLSNHCSGASAKPIWTRSIKASKAAVDTYNPVCAIAEGDKLNVQPNPGKPAINLSVGDPTLYGNIKPAESVIDAVVDALKSSMHHGYTQAAGMLKAREAIAKYLDTGLNTTVESNAYQLKADDIYIAHGCSRALDMALAVLCDSNGQMRSNILIPRPGYPLYKTLSTLYNIECREYRLVVERGFEADLVHMASLADENTTAIVVTNPGNPSGWLYSRQHLLKIIDVARRYQLPIIADETYLDFVFSSESGAKFIPMGTISDDVPVISCSAISKTFMVPGWRIGWIALYDRANVFDASIRAGLNSLCQRIQAPCSFLQAALPAILSCESARAHMHRTIEIVERNAKLVNNILGKTPCLNIIMPQASMFMLILLKLEAFSSDTEFVSKLIEQQSVYCLPGSIFGCDNSIRIVLTLPEDKMLEACERISRFCAEQNVAKRT